MYVNALVKTLSDKRYATETNNHLSGHLQNENILKKNYFISEIPKELCLQPSFDRRY